MTNPLSPVACRLGVPSLVVLVAMLAGTAWEVVPTGTVPGRSGTAAIAEAVRMLTSEAKQSTDTGQLKHSRSDFAGRFGQELPDAMVLRKLTRPSSRNAFVDGYVRWQLASFDPKLDLNDREFRSLVERLPAAPVNPRADRQLIGVLNAAVANAPLSDGDRAKLDARVEAMEKASERTRAFRRPSDELRDWIRGRSAERPDRQLIIELERCDALLRGGWEVDRVMATIERLAEQVGQVPPDAQARAQIGKAMLALSDRGTLIVRRVVIEEERVAVDYDDARVHDFEVRRWLRLLNGGSGG